MFFYHFLELFGHLYPKILLRVNVDIANGFEILAWDELVRFQRLLQNHVFVIEVVMGVFVEEISYLIKIVLFNNFSEIRNYELVVSGRIILLYDPIGNMFNGHR